MTSVPSGQTLLEAAGMEDRDWNETTLHFMDVDGSVFMLHHPSKEKVDALTGQGCMIIDEEKYRKIEAERMQREVPHG